jgi:FtsX extracellular domain
MDELRRLAGPLVADPPIPSTPVAEIQRRASVRRSRHRVTAIGILAVVVLVIAGSALAVSGRESSLEVGTTPGTTIVPVPDVVIYVVPNATTAQIDAVQSRLLADPDAIGIDYWSTEATDQEFKCLFARQPDLVESVRPEELPLSFRVFVAGGSATVDRMVDEYGSLAAVKEVATSSHPPCGGTHGTKIK